MSLTANTLPLLSISAPEPSRATNNGPNGLSTQANTSKKTGEIVVLEQEYAALKDVIAAQKLEIVALKADLAAEKVHVAAFKRSDNSSELQ